MNFSRPSSELAKTLPKVATEMALSVLAYNLTRVMNIVGTKPLMAVRDLRPNRSWLLKTSLERVFFTRPRSEADIGSGGCDDRFQGESRR